MLARPLTIHDAVQIALLENRRVRAWIRDVGVERGALVDASLPPNPLVGGSVRVPERGDDPVQVDLALAFDLANLILTPLRADLGHSRLEAARYRSALAILDFTHSVRIAFIRCQAGLLRAELLLGTIELVESTSGPGAATPEEGAEHARLGNQLLRAELELEEDRGELASLLGIADRDATVAIDARGLAHPRSEALEPGELERQAMEASVDLAWSAAHIEALTRAARLARTQAWLPRLELGARAELDGRRWEIGPEIVLELPVLGRDEGRVVAAEARLAAAREGQVAMAIAIRAAARASRNRVVTAQMIAARHHDVLLPAWSRALAASSHDPTGREARHLLLGIRRAYLDAALGYIDALEDYWEARVTLDQILAGQVPRSAWPE